MLRRSYCLLLNRFHLSASLDSAHHSFRQFSQSPTGDIIKQFDQLSAPQRLYLDTIKKDYEEASKIRLVKHSSASERFLGRFASLYNAYHEYCETLDSIVECHDFLEEPEMKDIAQSELTSLNSQLVRWYNDVESEILQSLQPSGGEIFLEIRMAAGGLESAIFARDLCNMYENIAASRGYKWSVLTEEDRGEDGTANVQVSVTGPDVHRTFQFEAGVHRVQRVPFNDTRVHTSTAVVLVTGKPDNISVEIDPRDLEITYVCASGPGGQFVNRTQSKCCIYHKPSGTRLNSQVHRESQRNKKDCLEKLSAILLKQKVDKSLSKTELAKQSQAKHGDRSDKIRTYNYKSGLITDHRYKVDVAGIADYFSNPDTFVELHEKVSGVWQLQKLAEIASELSEEHGSEKDRTRGIKS